MRILVVEDPRVAVWSPVADLRRNGHTITAVDTGRAALAACRQADLVVLDLRLPDLDGLEVCRRLRAATAVPLIALTDGTADVERVLGLRAGADDCLDRPYAFQELLARVEALARRTVTRRPRSPAPVSLGPLHIDSGARDVRVHGRAVCLTRKEFDLLDLLAGRAGSVVSRQQIMREIWRAQPSSATPGPVVSRTLDTHISSLRGKLGNGEWIRTVRGVGFQLALADPGPPVRPAPPRAVLIAMADAEARTELAAHLRRHGHHTRTCGSAAEALAVHEAFDLLLVDALLPDMDGVDVCRRLRAAGDLPVIALTEPGRTLDRILFLRAGSDDCVTHRADPRELMARADAVLRRARSREPAGAARTVRRGRLRLDAEAGEARFAGRTVRLTRKEFALLLRLASEPRIVHRRERLIHDIWGPGPGSGRTLDTHVSALRSKTGAPGLIVTVRGVGFRFGEA